MNIRAITFDVGGTLIEPWPSVGHVYAELAAAFGVNGVSPDWLTQNFIRAWKARVRFDYAQESWFGLVRETFAERSAQLPDEFFPAIYDRFAEASAWRIYDDVAPTIRALTAAGVRLGVVSNWDSRLRPLLERLGLMQCFLSLVISCEVGATKPDPILFQRAAQELGVAVDELLHVGDSRVMDVLGATNTGAQGRQVVRGGLLVAPEQLTSLVELLELVKGRSMD